MKEYISISERRRHQIVHIVEPLALVDGPLAIAPEVWG